VDTVRLVRDFGTISELFPEGVDDVRDLPYILFDSIRYAMLFASFDDNLDLDERPPKRVWLDNDKLKAHMEWVRRKRDREMKGESAKKEIEDPVDNDLAKGIRG